MKIFIIILTAILFLNVSPQSKWQKLNGPEGGKMASIICKGDTIITATTNGLVYYSFDKGANWERTKDKTKGTFLDFIFAKDKSIIAASYSDGLYKSYDLFSWTKIFNDQEFISLGIDTNGNLYAGTNTGKIYSSTNNGLNWDVLFNNYNNAILRFLTLPSGRMFAGAINDLFKKDLNDPNWTSMNIDSIQGYIRPFIDDSNNIYFFSAPWLLSSSDSGNNWRRTDIIPFLQGNYMIDHLYNKRMIAACSDETGWFGTGWGIAVSDDKGLNWSWSNNGFPPKFSACVTLGKSGNDTYVGTNAAGVFKSTDFGENWFPINKGITAANTLDITFDSEGTLYSASWSNGIHKSTDKGLSWKTINNGLNNVYLYSIVADDNDILIAGTDQGTFRSTDKGENWNIINSNFNILLFKDAYNRIYGLRYGNGLYRSTDLGNNWTRLDNGFINEYVYGFAIDEKNNIYAGTLGGAIYKSTDDGTTWAKVYQSSNSNSVISHISVSPKGSIFASNIYDGILRSTDDGMTWILKKADTEFQSRYPLAINKQGMIYSSGSNSKIYISKDNGETWNDITNNLNLTDIRNIIFDKEGKMYLATDESVWTEAPDSSVNITESLPLANKYSLEQNYPNPFNPTTTIKYSILKEGNVTIKIFNSLGQEIQTLLNESKSPGSYEINFNGSSFPSGVYFYRIQAGDFIQTKKMIYLR